MKDPSNEFTEKQMFERKQRLYELITEHITVEQRKGIIPIVFEASKDSSAIDASKYEFDLFSLDAPVCLKLE